MMATRGGDSARRQWPTRVGKNQPEVVVVVAARGGGGGS